MTDAGSGRFARVRALFEAALDRPTDERQAWVRAEAGDDTALAEEVVALLAEEARDALTPPQETALLAALRDATDGERDGAEARTDDDPGWPERIGPFAIEGRLGAGGMGVVYAARQEHPRRRVALKVVAGTLADPRRAARFRDEVDVLARLDHPGIARILEAGEHDDGDGRRHPWYAMELLEGARPIHAYVRDEQLDWRGCVELLADAAEAVQHAHLVGVIHRDLKSGNVLVDGQGRARVVDFGVARVVAGETTGDGAPRTLAGELVGTLGAMAPEQYDGHADVRSDVYALGALLYELVCGEPPHALDVPLHELARSVREQPAPAARALRPGLPIELEWVLGRCLEIEPARRYPSAGALAEDLRHLLAGEAVQAGAPGTPYRLRRWMARHRALLAVLALVLGLLGAGLAGTLSGLGEARRARADEERRRLEAERAATTAARVTDVLVELFAAPDPALDGLDVRVVDALRRVDRDLLTKLDDEPAIEAALRLALGRLHHNLGLFDAAARELERADTLYAELAAGTRADRAAHDLHDRRVDVLQQIARTAIARGRLDQAEAVLVRRTDIERHHGALELLSTLAWLRQRQDRLGEASALFGEALDLARTLHGDDHPQVWSLAAARGAVELDAQRIEAAAADLPAAAEGLVRHLGEDHPESVRALNNLAGLRTLQGRLDEAAELFERALAIRAAILPAGHVELVGARANLGTLHLRRGDVQRAARDLERAYDERRAAAALPDPDTLTMAVNLLGLHLSRGDGAAVGEVLGAILESRPAERAESARSAQVLENLARFLRDAGLLEPARLLAAEAVGVRARLQGDDHAATLQAAAQRVLLHVGTWPLARIVGELGALVERARTTDDDHALGALLHEWGEALMAAGRTTDAEPALTEAAALLEAHGTAAEARAAWQSCAELYGALGRDDEAARWAERLDEGS